MISAMLTAKRISAARRTWRGDRNDVATSRIAVGGSSSGLPVDEMERRQAEALGDGGAGGQRHHDADDHQRAERAEQPAVDAAQPIGHRAAFGSRNHVGASCRLDGKPLGDERAKAIAARLEIGELIVGGAGRRQQHDRLGRRARARRRARRRRRALSSVPHRSNGTASPSVAREFVARRADQIGLGDAAETAGAAARCRPPSACRRESRRCRGTTAAPSRRRPRWSPWNR